MILRPIGEFISYAGDTEQTEYLIGYAKRLGSTKIYVEEKYTDKDYIKDFQMFYSRSFEEMPNTVKRVFFFTDDLATGGLTDPKISDEGVQKSCIGFVTIKPVKDKRKNPIIGRTVFKNSGKGEGKVFTESKQYAHLAGREMCFGALPFKSQDSAVGACASTALWVVVNGLREHFDIPDMSLFEITDIANRCPPHQVRRFPSDGLTLGQMCSFLHEMGLEIDIMNREGIDADADAERVNEYFEAMLKAFMPADIPIIAGLTLEGKGKKDHHAVVISGYQTSDDGKISTIYVHDDQIGPYVSVTSDDGFRTWDYAEKFWRDRNYDSIRLEFIAAPLYHKIRLTFHTAWENRWAATGRTPETPSVRVANSNRYKKELRQYDLFDQNCLELPMPKYIWIYSFDDKNTFADIIHDATSANSREICTIFYTKK